MKNNKGKVFLIGAGPGDPGLITIKGKACIECADVIVYDYLAAPALLQYANETAEIIYVGKKGGHHTMPQEKINAILSEKARQGHTVARVKGGDPFIFGRGGEEAEVLIKDGVDFEIVPGVTSAIAAPAYAGIPLTHRRYTSTLAFVTGHEYPEKNDSKIDWASLAKGIGTIVFLMGVKNLSRITEKLITNGRSPDTPVALVRWGSTPQQVTVEGTLETIVAEVKKVGLKPPSVIVVGEVVQLRESMKWFEKRPLLGKRVIVTRAREQASDLVKQLSDNGAHCIECPTIKVVPPDDIKLLDQAIKNLVSYDWLIFTSVNGVNFFFDRLMESGRDVRRLHNVRTASIGPSTAKRLFDFGIKSDIIPESYRAESVVDAFKNEDIQGKKILFPKAKEARPVLPIELKKMGAEVDEITVYCTKTVTENAKDLLSHLEEKTIDLVTFTSSSTVKNFKSLLPSEKFDSLMQGVTTACIGPVTADTAKELGLDVHISADTYTIDGLIQSILQFYSK